MRNVTVYRLVNANQTSAQRALVVDKDLEPGVAWARLVELNKVGKGDSIFWALSEDEGVYDGVTINDRFDAVQSDLKLEEQENSRLHETVRNVTMEAVLSLLDCWGVHSTVEFPGYLHVAWRERKMYWAVGPIQDDNPDPMDYVWTGELHNAEDHVIAALKVTGVTLRELTQKLYCEMARRVDEHSKV